MCIDPPLVMRSTPIPETVLRAPPTMHCFLAKFASEAADNARLPFLRGAIDRLARRATEIDANFDGVSHVAVDSTVEDKGGNRRI